MNASLVKAAEIQDARLVLKFVMQKLTDTERAAMAALVYEQPDRVPAEALGLTRQAIFEARNTALGKMRRRLARLGVHGTHDLLSN